MQRSRDETDRRMRNSVRGGAPGGRRRDTDARRPRPRHRHKLSHARSRTPKDDDLKILNGRTCFYSYNYLNYEVEVK